MSERAMPIVGAASVRRHPEGLRVVVGPVSVCQVFANREREANADLIAAAFNSATAAHEMGFDPIGAVQALPKLLEAARAHAAWSWAEHEIGCKSTTFNERMELCRYAEWLTDSALAAARGESAGEYEGVPHLCVALDGPQGPRAFTGRADADAAAMLVDRVMSLRDARTRQEVTP